MLKPPDFIPQRGPFQVLKEAGPEGAYQDFIIEQLAERGVKVWEEARIAKGSIASTCGHDPAFVRIGVGTFALRVITHHPEVRSHCLFKEVAGRRKRVLAE